MFYYMGESDFDLSFTISTSHTNVKSTFAKIARGASCGTILTCDSDLMCVDRSRFKLGTCEVLPQVC